MNIPNDEITYIIETRDTGITDWKFARQRGGKSIRWVKEVLNEAKHKGYEVRVLKKVSTYFDITSHVE